MVVSLSLYIYSSLEGMQSPSDGSDGCCSSICRVPTLLFLYPLQCPAPPPLPTSSLLTRLSHSMLSSPIPPHPIPLPTSATPFLMHKNNLSPHSLFAFLTQESWVILSILHSPLTHSFIYDCPSPYSYFPFSTQYSPPLFPIPPLSLTLFTPFSHPPYPHLSTPSMTLLLLSLCCSLEKRWIKDVKQFQGKLIQVHAYAYVFLLWSYGEIFFIWMG